MATVDAMKTANKELRRQYGKIDIDKIEVIVGCPVHIYDETDKKVPVECNDLILLLEHTL